MPRTRPAERDRTSRALRAAALVAAVWAVAAAPTVRADDRPPVAESELRAALDRAWLAGDRDFTAHRAGTRRATTTEFADAVRARLRAASEGDGATALATPEGRRSAALAVAAALAARDDSPVSATTLAVIVLRRTEDAWATDVGDDASATAVAAFDSALGRLFAFESFADCWDARFGVLPEVVAWRAAHAPKVPDRTDPPPGPSPEAPPDTPRVPEAEPEKKAPELPSPFAFDAATNLIPLDRAKGWVGPWTGWIQEIPEKDNKRQRRPAKAVWIDRYEVTCAEYLRFLIASDAPKRRALMPVGWTLDERLEPSCPPGRERTPVTGVTLAQAMGYAEWAGKRLPTEDEWDRAVGGGDREGRAFAWGAATPGLAWAWGGGGSDGPVAVDAFPDDRTQDGIVGLAGNVAEIVATLPDRRDLPAKPGPGTDVVVRGGSWKTSRDADCAATFRWVISATQTAPHVGFRCVMDEAEYRRRFR